MEHLHSLTFYKIHSTSASTLESVTKSFTDPAWKLTDEIMTSLSSSDREKVNHEALHDGHVEHAGVLLDTVDASTEKKLLRKVDYRIIPMIMWSKSTFV